MHSGDGEDTTKATQMETGLSLHTSSKVEVATAVRARCSLGDHGLLDQVLDEILTNPKSASDVDDDETLNWFEWLIAGGATPEEFSQTVRRYDKAPTCGLVWTENLWAYRCRTCGISPYLSLCNDCFHKGNHEGHDFTVFKSETGGACDCGDINVIKESGCCVLHGPAAMERAQALARESNRGGCKGDSSTFSTSSSGSGPPEFLNVATGVMPRLFHRLITYLRAVEARKLARSQLKKRSSKNSKPKPKTPSTQPVSLTAAAAAMLTNPAASAPPKGHRFIKLLHSFSDMGVAMRQVMTSTLTSPTLYSAWCSSVSPEHRLLELKIPDHHKTFLEELVYWTVKREFPDDLVCLLLSLKSDSNYNEVFARAFITHYQLISQTILESSDPDRLCRHIAAVSVQLFSKEKLEIAMVEQMQLLHLLLRSLYDMIRSTAIPIAALPPLVSQSSLEEVTLERPEEGSDCAGAEVVCENSVSTSQGQASMAIEDPRNSVLKVIDCDNGIIKENYYWLIKSDLKELLSHGPVATKFFNDPGLLSTWFDLLTLLQGMNVNTYVGKDEPHIEHESESYVGAFMAELVISATLMWTLVSHLKDASSKDMTISFVKFCRQRLNLWHEHVRYPIGMVSFHLPLHRYLSTFIRHGLQCQELDIGALIPTEEELDVIVRQLLRLQAAYYGISTRLWARNGRSLANQAEYYVSSLFCNSMVDADLFLLQLAALRRSDGSSAEDFVALALEEFGVADVLRLETCLSDSSESSKRRAMADVSNEGMEPQEEMIMLENFLIFLATVTTVRTNLGISDQDLMALELSVLLCKSDKHHSELKKMLPEQCENDSQQENFETVLSQIADFQAPRNMQQGIFTPKAKVWEDIYDPIYTLLRSTNRADYQSSRDRYQDYVSRSKKGVNLKSLWPPFRLPAFKPTFMDEPGKILLSKKFLEVAFLILYHGVYTGTFSELVVSLCVYMLEVGVHSSENSQELDGFLTEVAVRGGRKLESSDEFRQEGTTESITTLLMQLYTKLSSDGSRYVLVPGSSETDGRIGDGPYFIGKVLDKLFTKSEACRVRIQNEIGRSKLELTSHTHMELTTEESEREEKRRKAKERRLNLMSEYAMKRQQFMSDSGNDNEPVDASDEADVGGTRKGNLSSVFERFQDHECVICMEKLKVKATNPFGLMTYLTPSNTLGYQRLHSDEGNGPFLKDVHKEIVEDLLGQYEDFSVLQHIPIDPGFGVQVQSCGHLIHQDCFTSYMSYVKKAPPPPPSSSSSNKPHISFTYKEYSCPLCRQLGNSFLPIIWNGVIRRESPISGNYSEISKLLKRRHKSTLSNSEEIAVTSFIRDINACAMNIFSGELVKLLWGFDVESPIASSFLLASHLRQAVNRQLKLTDSGAVAGTSSSSSSRKPSYLLPLLSVVKQRYRTLPVGFGRKHAQNWEMICGKRTSKGNGEIPTLLRDVETELFHFILDLPVMETGGRNVFKGVVQALYNLRVVQVLAAIGSQFTDADYHKLGYSQSQSILERIFGLVLESFSEVKGKSVDTHDSEDLMNADENGNHKNADVPETLFIENLAQSLLLPFLRTAAYLQHEILGGSLFLETSDSSSHSFSHLVEYLQLGDLKSRKKASSPELATSSESCGNSGKSCADYILWDEGNGISDSERIIKNWCLELKQSIRRRSGAVASRSGGEQNEAIELLKSQLHLYDKPSLISVPAEYDTIFEDYRKRKCQKCDTVPANPTLCLICGETLCLNELCCFDLELEMSEVVSHCQKKCGPTGLFLSVITSEILIVREKECCTWGSIFLDSFCEEDLELKRGKPLFLCQERLDILQRNWIDQTFYKLNLKWEKHENLL